MILSHRLQMTAEEFAVFEPLALAYIELATRISPPNAA